MNCFAKNCARPAAGPFDTNPNREWSSYQSEVGLCDEHLEQVNSGVPWVAVADGGWVMLIGEQVGDIQEFELTSAPRLRSGDRSWNYSVSLEPSTPWLIELPVKQVGLDKSATLTLRLTPKDVQELVGLLEVIPTAKTAINPEIPPAADN